MWPCFRDSGAAANKFLRLTTRFRHFSDLSYSDALGHALGDELNAIRKAGTWKTEFNLESPQGPEIRTMLPHFLLTYWVVLRIKIALKAVFHANMQEYKILGQS
jgi:hypothetical protein